MTANIDRRHLVRGLAAATALTALGARAQATPFPSRPVTLVVPFPAGGATDSLVRQIAELAGRELGQPVVVENKPGAAGVLGANHVVRAAPDGYTLSVLPEPVFRLPHLQKTAFDPMNDFSYVIHLSGYALGIAVRNDAPWRDWAGVVADAKKRPGQISYGTTGINGTMHVTVEEMAQRAGVRLNHVPYKGESEIIAAGTSTSASRPAASPPWWTTAARACWCCGRPGARRAGRACRRCARSGSTWWRTRPSASPAPRGCRRPWSRRCTTPSARRWRRRPRAPRWSG